MKQRSNRRQPNDVVIRVVAKGPRIPAAYWLFAVTIIVLVCGLARFLNVGRGQLAIEQAALSRSPPEKRDVVPVQALVVGHSLRAREPAAAPRLVPTATEQHAARE